ncbi:MAG: ribonuclease III [Cytophagales bacterium]|nr:MAG: ribonuclease III [Cytophagales bacterium]TAF61919.1 MAG: ribonuclease III [Cytophagales bacterium]
MLFEWIMGLLGQRSEPDKRLSKAVKNMTGSLPSNLGLYKLAMTHSSVAAENSDGFKVSNERLEYLGDAILGAVVADYLFKKYPYQNEGFLTEIRSRLVSREALNLLARKVGLDQLIEYDTQKRNGHTNRSVYGDAMEAFIGAVYLDKGYAFCQRFIVSKLLSIHVSVEDTVQTNTNYKSTLIEWAQKNGKTARFEIHEDSNNKQERQFKVNVLVDDEVVSVGHGFSKKKAEQDAARRASEILMREQH